MSTYQVPAQRPKPRSAWRTALIVAGVVLAVISLCSLGTYAATHGSPRPGLTTAVADVPDATTPTTSVATVKPKATKPAPKPSPTIDGEDLVHVGEDVPAGTYRVIEKVDAGLYVGCYWRKSRDAEGDQIIDNGFIEGGQPQVTLKAGVWFFSQGCPIWRRK